jgi:ankyrin repeat protein
MSVVLLKTQPNTSTVELLLLRRTEIPADDCGFALENAAFEGHLSTVELLLQSRTDIPANHVRLACRLASEAGHTPVVGLFLQHQMNMNRQNILN